MPLIDAVHRPGLVLPGVSAQRSAAEAAARTFIRKTFGPSLPLLFARNAAEFGIGDVPEAGVQVRFDEFGVDDVNVPDLWIKVQLSEEPPGKAERTRIRSVMYGALTGLIRELGKDVPNVVIDVFWGPSSGQGTVNGERIEW